MKPSSQQQDSASLTQQLAAAQAAIDRAAASLQEAGLPLTAELSGLAADIGRLQSEAAARGLSPVDLALLPGLIEAVHREVGRAEGIANAGRQQRQALAESSAEADYRAALQAFDRDYAAFLEQTTVVASEETQAAISGAQAALETARASGDPARIRAAEIALRDAQMRHVEEAAGKGDDAGLKYLPTLRDSARIVQEAEAAVSREEAGQAERESVLVARKAATSFPALPDDQTLDRYVADLKVAPERERLAKAEHDAIAEAPSSFDQFALPPKVPGADQGRGAG